MTDFTFKPSRRAAEMVAACVIAVVAFGTPARSAPPTSDSAIEAECRRYFKHAVCSEALGRWLPAELDDDRTVRQPTRAFDGFHGAGTVPSQAFAARMPAGTAFVHGSAGPPHGTAVYDRRHRIAFYGEGCCSYFTTVLVAGVSPPPVALANRDLVNVRTDMGIGLGDSSAAVMRVYGPAALRSVGGRPSIRVLSYENAKLPKGMPCVQRQTFGFRNDRLLSIELYNGC